MFKNCFIIMGFNTKVMNDGKEYNLNLSYERIIKPVLENLNIEYIRADEIKLSEIIDESMYQLLLCADLVIADITTLNPNALYELGIRYALKPHSTILIGDKDTKFPFDINHLRVFTYKHDGYNITKEESAKMRCTLIEVIKNIYENGVQVDSPVYKFIQGLIPPQFPKSEQYFSDVTKRFRASDNLCNLVNLAYKRRDDGDFDEAIKYYKRALSISKDEYIIKEIAVCIYQSNTRKKYNEALYFLKETLDIYATTNPEMLKALGTIYKNLWILIQNEEYAKQALLFYERSFVLYPSYNSGLNYGLMLFVISDYSNNENDKNTYRYWGANIYKRTRKICLNNYNVNDY